MTKVRLHPTFYKKHMESVFEAYKGIFEDAAYIAQNQGHAIAIEFLQRELNRKEADDGRKVQQGQGGAE
jgi:hypothetical protein